MNFPDKSIEQARAIVDKYKARSNSKIEQAKMIYDKDFYEINYGFNESIRSGNCGRYLHEIVKEADCFTMAGVVYLIAREAGLEPRMYWATNMKDIMDGHDPGESGGADHAFVTVRAKSKETQLVDPHMCRFGKIKFIPEENSAEIYERRENKLHKRSYGSLKELSEQDFLEKLEENRTAKGGRIALSASQAVHVNNNRMFITYHPENETLSSRYQTNSLGASTEPYKKSLVIELSSRVKEDGSFDLRTGELKMYTARGIGWSEQETPQIPLFYSAKKALNLWKIFDEIVKATGRKSKPSKMAYTKLVDLIEDSGFEDGFTLRPNSIAKRTVEGCGLEQTLKETIEENERSIEDFVKACKDDEISYRVLLRDAQYKKARDNKKSETNKRAWVFSREEHEKVMEEEFESYTKSMDHLGKVIVEGAKVYAKFKKGSAYHQARRDQRQVERTIKGMDLFNELCQLRRSKSPYAYNDLADEILFRKRFDVEKASIEELKRDLSEKDIKNAARENLFYRMIHAYHSKESLLLESFKSGLKKILDKRDRQ